MKKILIFGTLLITIIILYFLFWQKQENSNVMANSPKVSVILPTYNRESLLPRAMDSILNQTYPHFELIVINDGSKDNTQKILEEYAAKDKRIKIVQHEQNKGLIYGLNEGLDMATGKYIARMDDDDEAYPKRFEKQVAFLENHPEFAAIGSRISPIDSFVPYDFQQEPNPERIKIHALLGINDISHPTFMGRLDVINAKHIRYRDEYIAAEDRGFYADIMFSGNQLSNIPDVLLHYRLHNDNSTQYYSTQRQNIFRFQYDYVKRYFDIELPKNPPECYVSYLLIKKNKTIKLLDQDELEKIDAERCAMSAKKRLLLMYPQWQDVVAVEGKTLKSTQQHDYADILSQTDEQFTIRWKNGKTETFQKQAPDIYIYTPD